MMRAWLWDGSAGIEHVKLSDAPVPEPQPGEVVLQLSHAALNPADLYLAEGRYPYPVNPPLPHVLGRDGVGTIVKVGDGVKNVVEGDRRIILRSDAGVFRWGTFAEQLSIPADCLTPIPRGWSDEEASCASLVYAAGYRALTMWEPLKPQSVVLVTGASGGVGVATVQLAAAMGHIVVALSRNEEKQKRLRSLGAALTFNPENPGWPEELRDSLKSRGVDLAVDNIGGKLFPDVVAVMGEHGRISLVGELAGPVPNFDTGTLFSRRLRIGAMALGYSSPEETRKTWEELLKVMTEAGARPQIDQVFMFDQLHEAFERLTKGPMGKVLIRINP